MKIKKKNLSELKVISFITNLEHQQAETAKGGHIPLPDWTVEVTNANWCNTNGWLCG